MDNKRRALAGPDRTAAEWLIRNGARVRWRDSLVFHSEYNTLDAIFGSISQEEKPTVSGQLVESFIRPFPAPDTENSRATGIPNPGTFIEEVLADDATITAFGFAHFADLRGLQAVSMRNCRYVDDEAISRLAELQGDRLRALLLASCPRVTLNGLRDLKRFRALELVHLSDLQPFRSTGATACLEELRASLPSGCALLESREPLPSPLPVASRPSVAESKASKSTRRNGSAAA